jgi:hypothetical protein
VICKLLILPCDFLFYRVKKWLSLLPTKLQRGESEYCFEVIFMQSSKISFAS